MKFQITKKKKNDKLPIIMIVDDEPNVLKELEKLLSNHYKIITAQNGKEALDILHGMKNPELISLIICDQRMPEMTGVELLKELANNQIMPDTVRIILTAYDEKEVILSAINEAQIYKFILKNFDPDELVLTIKRAVEFFYHQQDLKQCKTAIIAKSATIDKLKMKIQDLNRFTSKMGRSF